MNDIVKANYRDLKRAFIERGFSVAGWARKNGLPKSTVYEALRGVKQGVKSTRILHLARKEAARA